MLANHLLGTFLCDAAHVIVKCSHPKYSGQDNVVLDQNVPAVQCQHDALSEAFLLRCVSGENGIWIFRV